MVKIFSQNRMSAGLLATLLVLSMSTAATASSRYDVSATAQKAQHAGTQYFIEFRARQALSYGHTYATFGRLNGQGKIVESRVAGLHPAGDSPVPWMIGHVFLVPSETGASDGDLEERYVSARYRVPLSEAEYRKVTAFIADLQANSPMWHAVLYNCNAFVADIAKFMGLKTPSSTLSYPADFINEMRTLNNGGRPTTLPTG
ncbi:hypothetical protein [Microvirga puerhi]|uniref:DUF4105 domain-containing protein n=1 Tax=Microvirga puerhi TaxID=2876078 RepID=A0ABS7VW71_9HYPH|nr:hypothetical protein [Microvirga puerhi]MBZ6079207.1 hypothetical protein [Microvirga puerhi]